MNFLIIFICIDLKCLNRKKNVIFQLHFSCSFETLLYTFQGLIKSPRKVMKLPSYFSYVRVWMGEVAMSNVVVNLGMERTVVHMKSYKESSPAARVVFHVSALCWSPRYVKVSSWTEQPLSQFINCIHSSQQQLQSKQTTLPCSPLLLLLKYSFRWKDASFPALGLLSSLTDGWLRLQTYTMARMPAIAWGFHWHNTETQKFEGSISSKSKVAFANFKIRTHYQEIFLFKKIYWYRWLLQIMVGDKRKRCRRKFGNGNRQKTLLIWHW